MKRTFRRRGAVLAAALVLLCAVSFADRGGPASFAATGWALLPPAVAIVLAFATKEVYSSLLAGCVVGALLTEGFAPWRSFETLFLTLMEGIDLKIFFFDVLLGAIVVLFARSGGSRAFGEWASRRVRSRRGAVTATAGLGCLIFLDDYFNCLTVGAIMQPITDRCRVSREKLSFIIDATAAPVCILAPISSWAAAVSSYIPADYSHVNGFALFIQAIPYNFYALLMLWLVFLVALTGRDFGPMYRREQLAIRQEPPRPKTAPEGRDRPRGRAVDLLLPHGVPDRRGGVGHGGAGPPQLPGGGPGPDGLQRLCQHRRPHGPVLRLLRHPAGDGPAVYPPGGHELFRVCGGLSGWIQAHHPGAAGADLRLGAEVLCRPAGHGGLCPGAV